MSKPEAILIEQRDGFRFLVGRWPNTVLISPDAGELLGCHPDLKLGDYLVIQLANGRAQYLWSDTDQFGNMICTMRESHRAINA